MPNLFLSEHLPKTLHCFGYEVMGPILAECCHLLHNYLISATKGGRSQILYCARGGLAIRRALELYLKSIEQTLPIAGKDFMVSRLAASRLALDTCPDRIAPLLALEFEGRSCAAVASALSGQVVSSSGAWAQPYTLEHFFELLSGCEEGRRVRIAISQQAELLRDHFFFLVTDVKSVHLVDTGVFGSIGHFLALGLQSVSLHTVLLFRANYKKKARLQLPAATGLVCNKDQYCPWEPRSVSRLYWPFIESFFESELPSVRTYRRGCDGQVLSNLELPGWLDQLLPAPGSVKAGAFDYLASLNPGAVSRISENASVAWRRLRRLIIYPRQSDIDLLGVSARGVDFGFDDAVSFGEPILSKSPLEKITKVRASLWPEGDVRRFFPRTAGVWLRLMEANRTLSALVRAMRETLEKL